MQLKGMAAQKRQTTKPTMVYGESNASHRVESARQRTLRYAISKRTLRALAGSLVASLATVASPSLADAEDAATVPQTQTYAAHVQASATEQATFPFPSAYRGAQSLVSGSYGRETSDVTAFLGVGGFAGFELWVNPEIDQGFGVSDGHGVGGVPNGEAVRINASAPYIKIPFAFVRETINLGGEVEQVSPDLNQLATLVTANRLVLTVGKMVVASIFDANSFAHDPRGDFFNAASMDTATFDFAGNANAETYGAVAELRIDAFTARLGVFDMATMPGGHDLDPSFGQFQTVGEIEARNTLMGRTGKIVLTGFYDRARFAAFSDIVSGGPISATTDIGRFRRYRSKAGFAANGEERLVGDLSGFFRAGCQDGRYESFGFTDVDRSFEVGLSLAGSHWHRPSDKVAVAFTVNQASRDRRAFFADGGDGLVLGDGKLAHAGAEAIVETYYAAALPMSLTVTFDAQVIDNPGFNADRGPAPLIGVRLHYQR